MWLLLVKCHFIDGTLFWLLAPVIFQLLPALNQCLTWALEYNTRPLPVYSGHLFSISDHRGEKRLPAITPTIFFFLKIDAYFKNRGVIDRLWQTFFQHSVNLNETSYIQFECHRVFKAGKNTYNKVQRMTVKYLQHVFSMKVRWACNLKHVNQARHIKCIELDQWKEDTWSYLLNATAINMDVEVKRNYLRFAR